jgi:protein-tyrosine phosphatase
MTDVLDWQMAARPCQVVRRAARALRAGGLVAFPTETVYGIAASARLPAAVERLVGSKGRPEDKPLTLAIGGPGEALDWVPRLSAVGRRLARRCWPGPLTIVCGDGVDEGLARRLPEPVRQRVCPRGTLGLRAPAHQAILQVLRRLAGPLVLTSANQSGEAEAVTPEEVLHNLGDRLDLLIADGPSRFGQASTVVQVAGDSWRVLREGVVSSTSLERLSGCMIVFVCTGNTCRSPMAEALCKKALADRLGCRPEELSARGFNVCSAGLSAPMGAPAAGEAVEAVRELGADLTGHLSRPFSSDLAAEADFVVAMTRGHVAALADQVAGLGVRPRLLDPDGGDVPDPIGADQETYRACARQIREFVDKLVPEVQRP